MRECYNYRVAHPFEGSRQFTPILLSRRGEVTAWALAFVTLITLLILLARAVAVPGLAYLLPLFFGLSAAAISLGNWMDRNTILSLNEEGVGYRNGLRNVHLGWDHIKQVEVLPDKMGDKVRVIGEHAYFQFRMLGEVRMHGELKGRMGFEQGDQILSEILSRSHLMQIESESPGRYYA